MTGPLPSVTMSRLPGENAVRKVVQRIRRKLNPLPRATICLLVLQLDNDDPRNLRGADILLYYDDGSYERLVIILATSK